MTAETENLLVVDDDPLVCDLVKLYLKNEGFTVRVAHDGEGLRQVMGEIQVDLVILDLMMPGEDGLSLTRYLCEHSDAAIIILTTKNSTVDRIVGLEMGADDYVTKPFDERELLARVRSVLRRRQRTGEASVEAHQRLRFSGWELDLDGARLFNPAGEEVILTTGEFALLAALASHPNRPLTRDQLLNATRNRDAAPFDRSIDVQVGRLRRKIEPDPAQPVIIRTVRGVGYRFTPEGRE